MSLTGTGDLGGGHGGQYQDQVPQMVFPKTQLTFGPKQRHEGQATTRENNRVQSILGPNPVARGYTLGGDSKDERTGGERKMQEQRGQCPGRILSETHVCFTQLGQAPGKTAQRQDPQGFMHVPRIFFGDELIRPIMVRRRQQRGRRRGLANRIRRRQHRLCRRGSRVWSGRGRS